MEQQKNTKNQILDASLKLFSEKSFHGASIRNIARAIEKRESSIYNHFKSKEDIFAQIILKFSNRNFGPIILTDKLINIIAKPDKFFVMLAENLLNFWNSDKERMFIKILLSKNNFDGILNNYSLENYLEDFRKLCEFIFKEMIKHKFIKKNELSVLSQEFISSLFLFQIEQIIGIKRDKPQKILVKNHVEFFWSAIKR